MSEQRESLFASAVDTQPVCDCQFCKLIAQGWVLIDPSGTAWATDTRPYASSGPISDDHLAKAEELARTIDAMKHWALMFLDAYQPCECNDEDGSICLAHRIVELAQWGDKP